ncbi:MAG: site-2 protease family protein [Anaerolineaceae bacterium]|nr:site-2 protease family protein [Anaerolineaceae bacterium]
MTEGEIQTAEAFDVTALVKTVFEIQSVTVGGQKQHYHWRYIGHLKSDDSEAAYDQLAQALKPQGWLPLFRESGKDQVILIVDQLPEQHMGPVWANILLFAVTVLSVMFTGAQFADTTMTDPFQLSLIGFLQFLWQGWPFAVGLLSILLAHEFGHYLVGRAHGEKVTLPYFIPLPFSAFGTMGAFINMKEVPRNRKHLLDIGMAGPLIGFVVAVVVLFIGLSLSSLGPIETTLPEGYVHFIEGNSLLYLGAKYLTFGQLLPQPVSYGDVTPFFYWVRYFFTGQPVPLGGLDVLIHPVAWAGWAGLFVTAMNLIPAGQLDGGHILYVLFGKKVARWVYPFIIGSLIALGFFWNGWWLWAGLIFIFGRRYAEPLDQITKIDRKRKWLGVLALLVFFLTFIPVPLVIIS